MLWPRRVWWLPGELEIEATAWCAGCGAGLDTPPDDAALREPSPATPIAGPGLAMPGEGAPEPRFTYCSTCGREQVRHREAALLAVALALLWGAACALVLPLFWPASSLGEHLLVTALAGALPIAGLGSLSRRVGLWGSPPRAWPVRRSGVVLEGPALADRLALAGVRCRPLWLPPIVYRPGVGLIVFVALALAALGHDWHHPRLWVIDLGPAPLTLLVDGVVVARLDPARPGASEASLLRLPSGTRRLAARDDAGRTVAAESAVLSRGHEHLFAPGGADECFWLERTGYGRDTTHEVRPLRSASRFFTLDSSVDGWLSGGSPPPARDRRSTGGTLTLLRHSPCPRAPDPGRRASATGP